MELNSRQQFQFGAALLLLIGLTLWCYWPGLTGKYLLDDTNNLIGMNYLGGVTSWDTLKVFVFGGHSGALGRPIAMLSFLLNDQAFPGDISRFRFTNLMLHCLCGITLFVFARRLLRGLGQDEYGANLLALLTAAWWLLAPINISTTLYVVQRMTQLSALFVMLGLVFYIHGREKLLKQQVSGYGYLLVGLFGCGGLAVLSKENGALIFVYAAVCEFSLAYVSGKRSPRAVQLLVLLPILALLAYCLSSWDGWLSRYQYRDFSLGQRLLTEASILWDYFFKAVIPLGAKFGLVHDDFTVANSLFSPWYTALAIAGHLAALITAWVNRQRWPLLFFAVGWFYGGHLLESTFIPLELYYEHRNYLPITGVYLALVYALWNFKVYPYIARSLLGLSIVSAAFISHQQAIIWGNPFLQTASWAMEHPRSVRAQTDFVGTLLATGQYTQAQKQLESMKAEWPELAHIDLLLVKYQCLGLFDSKLTVEDIVAKQSTTVFSGNLPAASKGLMDIYRQDNCEVLDHRSMLSLLEALTDLPLSKPYFNADSEYWQAEIYRNLGNLNGAILALDRAYSYSRDSIYRYTQAVLFASAGLGEESLGAINKALRIEQRKPLEKQKNINEYESFKKRLVPATTQ